MIKSVNIENFQSHKSTELDFHKGMNVIVGSSDSGKTAIIRALRWVINNRPGGDSFRSTWGGDTCVNIETSESDIISRNKTNSINSYNLNTTEFLAFGQDVPEEIEKAFNMTDVNLQQQLDNIFLISETSGNVAAHFNKVAKLDKIDKSQKYIQSQIRTINQNIEYAKTEVEELKTELETFDNLVEFETALILVEIQIVDFNKLIKNKTELSSKVEDIINVQKEIESKSEILLAEKSIDRILKRIEKQKEIQVKKESLKKVSIRIYHCQQEIKEAEKDISSEATIDKLLKMYSTLTETTLHSTQLSKLVDSISKNNKRQEMGLKSLKRLEKEFKDNFPAECPLCGTNIKDNHAKN